MRLTSTSNDVIAEEIGGRIESLRLKHNIGQEQLAEAVGISRETYRNLVKGRGTLINLIAVLKVLGETERLNSLVEEIPVSPLLLAKIGAARRIRASSETKTQNVRVSNPSGKPITPAKRLIQRKRDSGRGGW
ncbi:helix-turn-helix protein [Rahnella sp. BIGb0236]|uniref:helix-turn-helix transcriptional regulator n=1 Tax=Rahnella sp. BIGb0236 TaxID=2485117 RepID=UPI001061B63D|nr:helix-turn-helix transcriptional regulator [Rahnella sp. BIGb0236]TDS83448.1 helix-turn-helix protein [Rahnella sp. BIGb0236]